MKKFIILMSIILLSITLIAQENVEKKRLRATLELENEGIVVDNSMMDYLADESGEKIKSFVGELKNVTMVESYVVSNRIPDAKGIHYDAPRWKHEVQFLLRLKFIINPKDLHSREFIIFYLTGTGIWEIGREFLISIHPDGVVTIKLREN